jgi:hypothetical protein
LVEITGSPRAVKTREGKVSIEFYDQGSNKITDVDPLSIVSAEYGEHPADKALRLASEYGLTIGPALEGKLHDPDKRDELCQQVTFSYMSGKESTGVAAEVTPDGAFVTIAKSIPPEWRPPTPDYLTPLFFVIHPENVASSSTASVERLASLAREMEEKRVDIDSPLDASSPEEEQEMVKLRGACLTAYEEVFEAAQSSSGYTQLLEAVGYVFDFSVYGSTSRERVEGVLHQPTGRKSLYSASWKAARLKQLGVGLDAGDKMIREVSRVHGVTYFTTFESYIDSPSGRFYKVTKRGQLRNLYTAPGRMLLAMINPNNPKKLLVSAEGYEDARFHSLFETDLDNPSAWQVIHFPGTPRGGRDEIYALQGCYSADGGTAYMVGYGFVDEGGGIRALNLTDYSEAKVILPWDHMMDWVPLSANVRGEFPFSQPIPTPTPTPSPTPPVSPTPTPTPASVAYLPFVAMRHPKPLWLATTGKEIEVADPAMSINQARFTGENMNVAIVDQKRCGKVFGFNPIVRQCEEGVGGKTAVYCEASLGYRYHLEGRPTMICRVDIPS